MQDKMDRLESTKTLMNTNVTKTNTGLGGLKTAVSEEESRIVKLGTKLK